MKNSLVRVIALLVLIGTMAWSVETLDYISGEDIVVELRAAPSEVDDHHRSLVFLGAKELAIKATWRDEDLMVLKRGNTVSLGLYNSGIKNIPITILGDNGVFYQLQVRPATGDRPLSSVVRIRPGRGNAEEQRVNTNGRAEYQAASHMEIEAGQVLRLHKHIRGGRELPNVQAKPLYNEAMLREGERVMGQPWVVTDEFKEIAYYSWTYGNVEAIRIGITYSGREEAFQFNFQDHQTDHSLYIWPQQFSVLDRKYPGVTLRRGEEAFFIYYRQIEGGR